MQAIIPLAGKGTRLRPHTHVRPKPLVRVANRPVLGRVLDQLIKIGVDEVICITGHLEDQIVEYLESEYPDLRKEYVRQEEQLGTADAIRVARPFVSGPVLIVFVDTLFDADLGIISERSEDDGIMWAKEVEDYQRFGVIVTDEDGYMERIVEKPDEPISRLANIGVYYIRDHELLYRGVERVMEGPTQLGEYFLTSAFQYMIEHGARLYTAEVEGWWDCGKPGTLLETNRVLLERGEARSPEDGGAEVSPPVLVPRGAILEDAELGPNVTLGEEVEVRQSSLRDCIVGSGSVIENCRLENSLIGDHVEIRGISGEVNVADHSRLAG